MCGILGYTANSHHLAVSQTRSCIRHLAHRGPDAQGIFSEEQILLAHLRLSIIDLSTSANQPMHSHCQRYVMVYNGEVYNYQEIAQQIKEQNPAFAPRTQSDSEIILEAFATWHTDFVHKLNGMFAIAIWDRKEKSLYLFRDRIGIKPMYYFHKGGDLAFASELKALSKHPEIKKHLTLSGQALHLYLHLGYIPSPHSIYCEIHKFPAGHYGIFRRGELSLYPYWQPQDKILPGPGQKDPERALEQLRELICSSVKYRLIAHVPYGTFLSGGIDSSLVTAIAQSLHTSPINTFSIGFWEQNFDESQYARQVARHLGTHHHEMRVSEKEAMQWIPDLTDIYGEPFADSSAIPTLLVSQMARKHVTVTLSGDGGDELFMGYGAYHWAHRLSAPYIPWVRKAAELMLKTGPSRYKRAAKLFENPGKEFMKSHIFSQEQYLFSRKEIPELLHPALRCDFSLNEKIPMHLSHLTPREQQALFDLQYYLPDDLLVKVDRASMHFALETRVPLLDYRIVEWALNLHQSLKWKNGQTKYILKELLYQYVPQKIFDRPKRGFAIPLQKWLQSEMKDFAMDYLHEQMLQKTTILQPQKVQHLLDAFYKKGHHYLYNRIWQLVVLQKWYAGHLG